MKIENFYTAFGYLTCEFAELEADLRVLIAGLSFGDNMVTAAVFLDSSQLAENTTMLRKLARQFDDYETEMVGIARRIEKLRETRNLFIHGLWEPGDFPASSGMATVKDLNCTYKKLPNGRLWTQGKGKKYSLQDFNDLLKEIRAINTLIEALCEKLEKDDDLEFNQFGTGFQGRRTRFRITDSGGLELLKA